MAVTEDMLAEVSLFAQMDQGERASVANLLETRMFAPGDTIFTYGDASDELYIVRRGRVKVFVETTEGVQISLRHIEVGEVFGDIAMFDGGARTATAVATETSELLTMGREDVLALVKMHPQSAIDLLRVVGHRLRETNDLLRSQVSRNPNVEEEEILTFGQRVADRVAAIGGSWRFIVVFSTLLVSWMGLNAFLGRQAFDAYPYILLNLVLSTVAAFQAPVIMMSQNRLSARDRLNAELDYRVNVKAELEVAQLHNKIDRVYETVQRCFVQIQRQNRQS